MTFMGLDSSAFETYTQDKWSSMVHNLARMKAKEIMLALCGSAASGLEDELTGLVRGASDEIPNITNHKRVDSQWVFWFRDPKEREDLATFLKTTPLDQATLFNIAPQDKHATLAVILREKELWVGFRIAPGAVVDRRNIAAKLGKAGGREALLRLLQELPEGTLIGFEGRAQPANDVSEERLVEMGQEMAGTESTWLVGHRVPVDEAIELGPDLADHLGRWIGVLLPVYRYATWSRENDFIEATKQLQEEKAAKRKQATSYQKGDKVRIVSGLFSGKLGTVEKTDTKAQVRVRVGQMSVVVSGHDLTPA